jgi:Fe-S cluster biogenesis protein NfuA
MTKVQMEGEILKALAEIRPFLNNDGGDISFLELTEDYTVKVKLHGACNGCSVNQMTLKSGVEMTIKKYLPEINEVVEVN